MELLSKWEEMGYTFGSLSDLIKERKMKKDSTSHPIAVLFHTYFIFSFWL